MASLARRVVVERVDGRPATPLPRRATEGSAGYDLHSAESVELRHGAVTLVRTGLRMRAPKGHFLEVRPRSGLSSKGVLMVNAPGTIDRDYPGEIMVPLTYLFPGTYRIEVGDRIGQLRLASDVAAEYALGPVEHTTSRRGGFGSTGR
ncbi:MAG: dUTP diphosphatase [Thermoplasmata archaeon]